MLDVTYQDYSAIDQLRDGSSIEVRALRPGDETQMLTAVSRLSAQSLRRRFFGPKKGFSEREKAFFLNANFTDHVAVVATTKGNDPIEVIGGARYVVTEPGVAEVAFAVIDEFQGKGVGTALLRHLVFLASQKSLKQLTADVLLENTAMINVFRQSGLPVTTTTSNGVVHVRIDLI